MAERLAPFARTSASTHHAMIIDNKACATQPARFGSSPLEAVAHATACAMEKSHSQTVGATIPWSHLGMIKWLASSLHHGGHNRPSV